VTIIINNFRQPELKILVFVVSDLIEDLGTYFVTVFRKKNQIEKRFG
jgi:hypothetical protein